MGPPFLEGPSDSHQAVQISIATSRLSFGWFVAFGLIGAIGDVPGMTARDALLPAVCKKDGVDMRRFVGVSQSAESLVAVVGPSASAERAVS